MKEFKDLLESLKELVENEEQYLFEKWLDKTMPSGDCESVSYKWKDSYDYSDFLGSYDKQITAIEKAEEIFNKNMGSSYIVIGQDGHIYLNIFSGNEEEAMSYEDAMFLADSINGGNKLHPICKVMKLVDVEEDIE